MQIEELGGEFKLIERIVGSEVLPESVVIGNGDDAAVVRCGEELMALSVDCFREGRHFRFDYADPVQIGRRAVEAAASDIVAIGGKPQFVLVGLEIGRQRPLPVVEEVYQGVHQACSRIGAVLLGGDTVAGPDELALAVTVVGRVANEQYLCPRSGARAGDAIWLSGATGAAALGLELLAAGVKGYQSLKQQHQEPCCRLDLVDRIAPYATAMIDLSDGLSSDLFHIAQRSAVACVVERDRVPITPEIRAAAEMLHRDPLEFALHGGEDFELLYTLRPEDQSKGVGHQIGMVTQGVGIWLKEERGIVALEPGGWDHFR